MRVCGRQRQREAAAAALTRQVIIKQAPAAAPARIQDPGSPPPTPAHNPGTKHHNLSNTYTLTISRIRLGPTPRVRNPDAHTNSNANSLITQRDPPVGATRGHWKGKGKRKGKCADHPSSASASASGHSQSGTSTVVPAFGRGRELDIYIYMNMDFHSALARGDPEKSAGCSLREGRCEKRAGIWESGCRGGRGCRYRNP
ncbi:hypothetical protein DENSPDRAFT_499427 [Dentipellis sp. KUC8613]|nr:hypothetical protein DENSPDRAFT_499427 [Dentipellis sp. KUC8613]